MARVLNWSLPALPGAWLVHWLIVPAGEEAFDLLEIRNRELQRLKETAPHLLDDIGMAGRAPDCPETVFAWARQ